MLEQPQQPQRARDREADGDRDRKVARQVHAQLRLEEHGEEADQQRSRDEQHDADGDARRRETLFARHEVPYTSRIRRAGSSSASLIATSESTASRPSTMRWSYERAR